MPHSHYLIIGGGMTADSAIQGIRQVDAKEDIHVIAAESHPPYNRPPLSKGLWKGDSVESIWRPTRGAAVELTLNCQAKQISAKKREVTDSYGTVHTFNKLLLAAGGSVRRLPFGGDDIIYYRTFDDYQRLRDLTQKFKRFAVIGGGFIGWEIAAALAMSGRDVTMIFPDAGIGSRMFPPELVEFLNRTYREKGVVVLPGETAVGLEKDSHGVRLKCGSGRVIATDGVVAGIGIEPNAALAESAGLKTANGVCVNETLQTSHPDVYAAGDVAEFYNPLLGKRIRVEHEDNANAMGVAAGLAMAGQPSPYHYLPFFYSDLFDMGFEAVGEVNSRLETFSDWKTPFKEGVIYYLAQGGVRGVLLWNIFGQVDAARNLIREPATVKAADLKGRLPAG